MKEEPSCWPGSGSGFLGDMGSGSVELALTLRLVPLQPYLRRVPKVGAQNEIVRNPQFHLDFSFKEKPHHHSATAFIFQNPLLTPSFLSESVHTHCPSGSVAWHEDLPQPSASPVLYILPWVDLCSLENFAFHPCATPWLFAQELRWKGTERTSHSAWFSVQLFSLSLERPPTTPTPLPLILVISCGS